MVSAPLTLALFRDPLLGYSHGYLRLFVFHFEKRCPPMIGLGEVTIAGLPIEIDATAGTESAAVRVTFHITGCVQKPLLSHRFP